MRVISLALGLLVLFSTLAVLLGVRPKPCPRHICFPRSEIVTAEQLLARRKVEAEAMKAETDAAP
jgi:hypothetical protein